MKDRFDAFDSALQRNRWWGVYPALVTDIKDPDGQGRVKIKLPWCPDNSGGGYEVWARLAMPMAGNQRGTWFIPDPNDEVLVSFEGGDPRIPYVIGALWNGQDQPPETMDSAGNNFKKTICSRKGIKITLDDRDGTENLILETPGGQKLTLKDGPGAIEIQDSNGNSLKFESSGITLIAAAKLTIQAGTSVETNTAIVTTNAGMSKFSGVVKSDTNITSSTVSASYSPGAGNIW
ncbi:phage baseplate assembly protein V [Nitrosomonas nitrosa]|uniref:phage baseplate assembly protein V n=1 Tax=Nitrosomonas nitrosa TaxID=52442 RepID=UPI0023F6E3FE|nr:phage baseplate assembly protein V [Nitrosomonas nitrosa]MCO6434763.1 type IV secretion protein Rhs [Nitrosomonas nitrosa]